MTLRDQFLTLARLYAQSEGIELSRLSSRIFDDSKKIPALEAGSDITTGRFEVAVAYIAARWPADMEWPPGVYRPSAVAASTSSQAA